MGGMEPRYVKDNAEWVTLADELMVNQYAFHDDRAYRKDASGVMKPAVWKTKFKEFKPRNAEQMALFSLLDDDNIPIKVAKGVAGSGKTLCALKFGLAKVYAGKYDKLLIIRNPVVIGEGIGYLKGDYNDKLEPWLKPIADNLDGGIDEFDRLVRDGKLEFDVVGFVQGRSIANTFIIVTEAQNLTRQQMKMAGTRCGEGSVIVFDGDEEQIANQSYAKDNGMLQVVEKLAGNPLFGYVRLVKSERSAVADLFAHAL